MSNKYKLAAIIFVFLAIAAAFILLLFKMTGNDEDKATAAVDITATPGAEKTDTGTSQASPAVSHTPSASPESEQTNEQVITGIEISNRFGEKKPVAEEDTVVFSGYAYLLVHMDCEISKENIAGHIFVDDELINPLYIYIQDQQKNTANVFLPGDLPENFTVRISPGLTDGRAVLNEDIVLNFRHYPEITCSIRNIDIETGEPLPKSIYLAGGRHAFLFEFSRPMDRTSIADSLRITADRGTEPEYTVEWIDDTRFKLILTNVEAGDYLISIQNAKGTDNIFRSMYTDNYRFSCIKEQRLFKLDPETGKISVIAEFMQGMRPLRSFSPLKNYIVFGIVEEEEHEPAYSRAAYSLENGEMFMLKERFENAARKLSVTRNDEYFLQPTAMNTMIKRDEWTNDGRFIYHDFKYIAVLDFNTGSMNVLYASEDENILIVSVFCLNNGEYAIV